MAVRSMSAILGLVSVLNLLILAAQATELLQRQIFEDAESCEGTPYILSWLGISNQCIQTTTTSSAKYTCTSFRTFNSVDCTGTAATEGEFVEGECAPYLSDSSQTRECVVYPDHKIGMFQLGNVCTEEGGIDLMAQSLFILDVCQQAESQYMMYTLSEDELSVNQAYSVNPDCSDPELVLNFPIGPCEMRDDLPRAFDEFAVRIIPALDGATLSKTPPTESPTAEHPATHTPTKSPGEDDNGSSAVIGTTTSTFAFAATAFGTMVMMF